MAWADLKREVDEYGRPRYQTRLDVSKEVWEEAVGRFEPEMRVEGREVAAVGGLHIIGTERHESRRIDNQLRGRAGRQGDPGSSRFFLSLEDDLMRKFAGEWVANVLTRLGMQEGEAIESLMVSRRIEGAQKKVEERNFDMRKNLLEYDEVMDEQRKRVYSFRQSLLEGASPKEMILEMIDGQIQDAANRFLADDYGAASFAEWAGQRLGVEIAARDLKGASFEDAEEIVRNKAERQLGEVIREAMEENLPTDADPSEWTWQALARWANERFDLNLKERDLKKYAQTDEDEFKSGRDELEELLNEKAAATIAEDRPVAGPRVPRARLGPPVAGRLGSITSSPWRSTRRPGPASTAPRSSAGSRARPGGSMPSRKPSCRSGSPLTRYPRPSAPRRPPRYDREGLAAWASERYHVVIEADELRPMLRPEIEALLLELAHQKYQGGRLADELERRLDAACLAGPRDDKDAPTPIPRPSPSWRTGPAQTLGVELDRRRARRRSLPPRSAHSSSPRSTPSTAPRCARWRRSSSSRSSTRAGWNTSAPWTTSAARSASRAMPRSIPRSSTSARACGSSPRCGTASPTGSPT